MRLWYYWQIMAVRTKSKSKKRVVIAPKMINSNLETVWQMWRIPLIILLSLALFWFKTNSWPVAALVNYRPIWRWQLDELMYRQIGRQTLDNLVTEQLIKDELMIKKVQVEAKDVDAKIEDIKKQIGSDESFNQALTLQGMTVDQLKQQIGMQMGLEKLVEPSTDSAKFQKSVYGLVQKLRSQAKVWTWPTSGKN